MRLANEITQSRIAEELNCGQSRISKIEIGDDDTLSLREIEAYAKVLNCEVEIRFSKRGSTAVDRIKGHAMAMKREMENLCRWRRGMLPVLRSEMIHHSGCDVEQNACIL